MTWRSAATFRGAFSVQFRCKFLVDPVGVNSNGVLQVFERAALLRWVEAHGTNPLTRAPVGVNEFLAVPQLLEDCTLMYAMIRQTRTNKRDYLLIIEPFAVSFFFFCFISHRQGRG